MKVFPLRVSDNVHTEVEAALAASIIKSKHKWIEQAIAEKLARDKAV